MAWVGEKSREQEIGGGPSSRALKVVLGLGFGESEKAVRVRGV